MDLITFRKSLEAQNYIFDEELLITLNREDQQELWKDEKLNAIFSEKHR